jgi:pimeloyl-ACP methyl ester carboxylesterase
MGSAGLANKRQELFMAPTTRILAVSVCVLGLCAPGRAQVTTAAEDSAITHYQGAIGPGSFYEIDLPAAWNGDLVLYAHGIVQADLPVAPPSTQDGYDQLRGHLLANGFAVAASSYSSNGWSLADAVRRTHQLGAIAASKIGRPRRTFLVGHSMGALAIVKLAERYPSQYDGVLAMCGPLGGALPELQYAGNARVTFDFYFPGVLPGTTFDVPAGTEYLPPGVPGGPSLLFLSVYQALSTNPFATAQWAAAAKLPFNDAFELGNSALYVVGFLLRYSNDFIERVNGKMPFDNLQVEYEVNVTPDPQTNAFLSQLLNAGVDRIEADVAAVNYYDHHYTPTGRISFPVITLHTTRDAGIPYEHEDLFARAVAGAGSSDWLLQRPIDRWGHCAFTAPEVATAFDNLVGWVTTGQRP